MAFIKVDKSSTIARQLKPQLTYLRIGAYGQCAFSAGLIEKMDLAESNANFDLEIDPDNGDFRIKVDERGIFTTKSRGFSIPVSVAKLILKNPMVNFNTIYLSSVFFIMEKKGDYYVPVLAKEKKPN